MPPTFSFSAPVWLDETPSTNDWLKARAASGACPSGFVVAARRQTRGRGRRDAPWESADGGDLTFSFLWRGAGDPVKMGACAMACALGVRDVLAAFGVDARCKWPNDVLAGDAKICGILAEARAADDGAMSLVVGIGLNLRRVDGRDVRLARKTAALEDFVADVPAPERLLPELLARLAPWLAAWENGGFAALRPALDACLWGVGREVAARTPGGAVRGVVEGLGERGELLLRQSDGTLAAVASVSALEGWET